MLVHIPDKIFLNLHTTDTTELTPASFVIRSQIICRSRVLLSGACSSRVVWVPRRWARALVGLASGGAHKAVPAAIR